jgi:hypothetical protein
MRPAQGAGLPAPSAAGQPPLFAPNFPTSPNLLHLIRDHLLFFFLFFGFSSSSFPFFLFGFSSPLLHFQCLSSDVAMGFTSFFFTFRFQAMVCSLC